MLELHDDLMGRDYGYGVGTGVSKGHIGCTKRRSGGLYGKV